MKGSGDAGNLGNSKRKPRYRRSNGTVLVKFQRDNKRDNNRTSEWDGVE